MHRQKRDREKRAKVSASTERTRGRTGGGSGAQGGKKGRGEKPESERAGAPLFDHSTGIESPIAACIRARQQQPPPPPPPPAELRSRTRPRPHWPDDGQASIAFHPAHLLARRWSAWPVAAARLPHLPRQRAPDAHHAPLQRSPSSRPLAVSMQPRRSFFTRPRMCCSRQSVDTAARTCLQQQCE